MRVSEAALALITFVNPQGETEYLAQWNEKWQAWSLIGGHRHDGESFRDCCIREIEEELGLKRDVDFTVAAEPIGPTCEYSAFSQSAREETQYRIELFPVELIRPQARTTIDADYRNEWLLQSEILAGKSHAGKRVADQIVTVLTLSGQLLDRAEAALNHNPPLSVKFHGRVCEELPESIQRQLRQELQRVFQLDKPDETLSVLVPRIFSGYHPDFNEKIVLAVEVTRPGGYERHIVKVGQRDKVEADFKGWQQCTQGRMVASRIFAPVVKVDLSKHRVAVIYRDAFSLFGPDEGHSADSAPKLLEEAIQWAVQDNEPDPMSAQRAISHIFTDLGMWFYRSASEDARLARAFYAKHLQKGVGDASSDTILTFWEANLSRGELRRHAVWVLCGRDVPDADPESKPARYLDPVDFVRWSMQDEKGHRLPKTLVGRTHGDLHARNVLVGVRRGEVQYPAVFDYGDMGAQNVLAWDFAKLETELKVRLLPAVIRDPVIFQWLVDRSKLRKATVTLQSGDVASDNSRRANRLAAFLAFEELIDDLSKSIEDRHDVERLIPLTPPSGLQQLDRLAEIVLRVRQEAAYWLGFKTSKRQTLWKDELYFALAVYGLLNVRWDYSGPEQEAALISSGVALARMRSTPKRLKHAIESGPQSNADYPSYRVPLALCYNDWKKKEYDKGCTFVEDLLLTLHRDDPNILTKIEVRRSFQHAVPLVGQALLLQLEIGHLHAVEPVLEKLRSEARTFHDFETLARIGRVYKDAADRKFEEEAAAAVRANEPLRRTRSPSLQMYDKSFDVYQEAYLLTKDWYVGINAATLALLTGKLHLATEYATAVAKVCAERLDHEKKDRYWLFATEGEAALLLDEQATDFYQSALSELTPGQWGMADSSYKQAIRLWRFFGTEGDRRVGPVLCLFETSDAKDVLTRGFLGRNPQGISG